MSISVIVPCYRSRKTLTRLVAGIVDTLKKLTSQFEIILVVDGSPDDTYTVARELERQYPGTVRAILLRRNYGQHNALMAGLVRARYEITVTMDDDLQHPPEELPALLAPLSDPLVDLVYGVATDEEHGFFRSWASRTVKAALAAADVPNAKDVSALRAFRTDLRDGFSHVADQFSNLDVLLSWTTNSVVRVNIAMNPRPEGESGYTLGKLFRHAMNMVTGYGTLPLKFVTWLGLATSVLGFILLVVTLVQYLVGIIDVAGFTTLASLLALLSGAMMLSIGILGEYLGRLHFRSMQRPTFLVRVDANQSGPRAGLPGISLPWVGVQRGPDEIASALTQRFNQQPTADEQKGESVPPPA